MPNLSAVIITYNEELFIEKCLVSLVGVADEIIVVDSFSTDSTEMICNKFNVRFIKQDFLGYVEQKNFALSLATWPHVLSLDADEALSDELKKSILKTKDNFLCDGYFFNRLNNFCGQWMKYSNWYPDKHLRLFDSTKGNWVGPNPHDTFRMKPDSKTGKLNGDLLHWAVTSIEDFSKKIEAFSDITAREYFKAGKKVFFLTPAFHMIWRFVFTYFFHLGFLDGKNGFIVCSLGARSSYLKYFKLIKLTREKNKNLK
jgi:glycosyltransferase involved in cell wall biosynthesis